MIALKRIAIKGRSSEGAFEGELSFDSGLNVISGPNSYGKSLASSAIAWCLGLEPIYGVPANDSAIFKDAVRHRIQLGGSSANVAWSEAQLDLDIGLGRSLSLSRPIVGAEAQHVAFTLRSGGSTQSGKLITGWGTMADATAGFQSRLFEWCGLPVKTLMTAQGKERPLYFENLAPLFFVEQLEGWTDIQALQVHRYQLIQVREAAFEYLLGLDGVLARRLAEQSSSAVEQGLKREADALLKRVNELVIRHGLDQPVSAGRSLTDLASFFSKFELKSFLETSFNWSFVNEQARLNEKLAALRTQLNTPRTPGGGALTEAVSARVLDLKQQITNQEKQLREIRQQIASQQRLVETLEDRIKSAKDLLRLKQSNVGILERAECPTCHQHIEPSLYNLGLQQASTIEAHIETLQRDREALLRSLTKAGPQVEVLAARLKLAEDAYFLEQRRLEGVNSAVGPEREALVDTANSIVAIERELDRNREAAREADEIQGSVAELSRRLASALGSVEATRSFDEEGRLESFRLRFGSYLADLGHSEVPSSIAEQVVVDDEYVPHLRDRRLRSLGSASDRARLVFAYTLALLEQAKASGGGHHPGFVFYDEPLQQNPDPQHRSRFREFLARDWSALNGQVVIFTSLLEEDVRYLRDNGVPLRELEGTKWLKPSGLTT